MPGYPNRRSKYARAPESDDRPQTGDLVAATVQSLMPIIQPVADDPRRLKPGQCCRILNSTPLGTILDDRKLRSHRQRAGNRIGDGRTVDLLRYAGWLAAERYGRQVPNVSLETQAASSYERKKDTERRRNALAAARDRDLGEIPKPKDPERRARAAASVRTWCETYLPHWFHLGWSKDLDEVATTSDRVLREGGQQPIAMPRGGGKSTLAKAVVLMAACEGLRRFIVLVGANQDLARGLLDDCKHELLTNERLAEDYPEVCIPILNVEDIANRCKGQTHNGEKTFIEWGKNRIVMPTIEGSKASGVVLWARGLTSGMRGMNVKGTRPDFALLDDIQTDQSARSLRQIRTRLKLIKGSVRGLAGPCKEIALFAMITVIQPDDAADQLLNPTLNPDWQGKRYQLLYRFPKRMKLWREYYDIRRQALLAGARGRDRWKAANAFYAKHRKQMDEGAVVGWEARHEPFQLSGLQYAMDLYFDDEETFLAEYQNTPKREDESTSQELKATEIQGKVTGLPKARVPLSAVHVVGFIDVGHYVLHWMTSAWASDMTGGPIEYNAWPEQSKSYFTAKDASPKLADKYPNHELKAQIKQGLIDLARALRARQWVREGDNPSAAAMALCLVDWGEGEMTREIAAVCRLPEFHGWLVPSKGVGIGPADKQFYEYQSRENEILGHHWLYKPSNYGCMTVDVDVNYWKSHVHDSLALPFGNRGSITFYGEHGTKHEMLAEHCCAESRTRLTAPKKGRSGDVWKKKPGRADNHFFDCLVGTAAAASMKGCTTVERERPQPNPASPPPPPPPTASSGDDDRVRPLF